MEGARRLYGYEPEEVVGREYSSILHTPEDVEAGKPREYMDIALRDGKWEGTIERVRKNGQRFQAREVTTPRRDASGSDWTPADLERHLRRDPPHGRVEGNAVLYAFAQSSRTSTR